MPHYKISDIAYEVKDRENNPAESKYDRFVGLEHYVSGDVIIRNYGSTDRLESTMKIFQSGDVLVARRNVYLKRASVVDFDGLTSGDTIVLRPKDEVIGRILPFVLNTDAFWDFADQYSDGTMSKRLSPKTLMNFEFDLPEGDELSSLTNLLWAINETKESYQKLLIETDNLVKSQFIEMFGSNKENDPMVTVEQCCKSITGGATPSMQHPEYYGGKIPFIKSGDVKEGTISKGTLSLTELALEKTASKLLPAKTVLVVVRSAVLRNEFHIGITDVPVVINQDIKAFQPTDEFLPEYLLWGIKSREDDILRNVQTMLTSHIEMKYLLKLQVKRATLSEQEAWVKFVQQADKSKFELNQNIEKINALMKSLISQDFSN